ncbi:MAG TPA: DNA ligase D, partial [Chitinophagaceae bacterium]|nr:DNA ligase D [Chitinophagaceae bacterium]
FVIQKHDASHLHYDFRIEIRGVLKSWAVPKGPSLNPADKRLAMLVEDHPYEYKDFEGQIPEGNYGAGTVIIWDEGTYVPMEGHDLSVKEQEKFLLKQFHSGNIKLTLKGKKLKGDFALFSLKDEEGRSWLLVKKEDRYSTEVDVLTKNKSVRSAKTLAQVAKEHGATVKHPEKAEASKRGVEKPGNKEKVKVTPVAKKQRSSKKQSAKKKVPDIDASPVANHLLGGDVQMPMPIKPMLAVLTDQPFSSSDWLFEIKWDGYRALAYIDQNNFDLLSRNNLSFKDKYAPVAEALQPLKLRAVLDGEIVAVNEEGRAEFQLLQNWQTTREGHLCFYVFDIIWLNGKDLTQLPLLERKKILQQAIPASHDVIKYSDHVLTDGEQFFEVALKGGLEGIMAKRIDSSYDVGGRTKSWLKIKVNQRQEVVIAGFTAPRNSRQFFGALLLGVYQNGELTYVGHSGSGFNSKSLQSLYKKMQPLIIERSPFRKPPKTNSPATWVQPNLVAEIKFTEWTQDLQARHPIFMGLREDKDPRDVIIEKSNAMAPAKNADTSKKATKTAPKRTTEKAEGEKTSTKKKGSSNKLLDMQNGVDQLTTINGHQLKFTNLDKLYWKKEKITKGDMLNYYSEIAPFMLPYMKDRPQSLNRHPNGAGGANFYQKDVKGKVPEWLTTHETCSESTSEMIEYLVCDSEASLLYMANLGCIEMNPWHSRRQTPDQPDYCLIDLDPDNGNTYDQVVEVAILVKDFLEAAKIPSFPKTSGSTGMHIFIPLAAKYSYEQSKQLAELVVNLVQVELPEFTSTVRSPAKRKGKIYLDYLQNRESQTVAAPYSLRPKPGAPVSTPLDWSEVKKGLTATTYHIHNIFDRLKTTGDLFHPVLGKGINLPAAMKKLESLRK